MRWQAVPIPICVLIVTIALLTGIADPSPPIGVPPRPPAFPIAAISQGVSHRKVTFLHRYVTSTLNA